MGSSNPNVYTYNHENTAESLQKIYRASVDLKRSTMVESIRVEQRSNRTESIMSHPILVRIGTNVEPQSPLRLRPRGALSLGICTCFSNYPFLPPNEGLETTAIMTKSQLKLFQFGIESNFIQTAFEIWFTHSIEGLHPLLLQRQTTTIVQKQPKNAQKAPGLSTKQPLMLSWTPPMAIAPYLIVNRGMPVK
jgi:hypothetical protein